MQRICNKYANICIEYAQNMQKIYAQICKNMQFIAKICKYMQHSLCHRNMQKYAKICKVYACYMQKHAKYAITILYAEYAKTCTHYFADVQCHDESLMMKIHEVPTWQV